MCLLLCMGQQQLILTILVTVLIGIATAVAINTFQNSRERANVDAIRQQVMSAHNFAVAYYNRPVALGGGGGTFNGINLQTLNLPDSTADGKFSLILAEGNSQEYIIIVSPASGIPDITFTLGPTTVVSDLD